MTQIHMGRFGRDFGAGNISALLFKSPPIDGWRRYTPQITRKARENFGFFPNMPSGYSYWALPAVPFDHIGTVTAVRPWAWSPPNYQPDGSAFTVALFGPILQLSAGAPGFRLRRGLNIKSASDGGVEPPEPSSDILEELAKNFIGHLLTTASILKDTNWGNPLSVAGSILSQGGNTVGALINAVGIILSKLNLSGSDTDSVRLGDWVLCTPDDNLNQGSLPDNRLFTAVPNPKERQTGYLDALFNLFNEMLGLSVAGTIDAATGRLAKAVGWLGTARDLIGLIANLQEANDQTDIVIPPDNYLELMTEAELRALLQKTAPLLRDLQLMVKAITNSVNRSDSPFYCQNENTGQMEAIACILRNLSIGGSGAPSSWTEELINTIFINPDTGEPYFRYSIPTIYDEPFVPDFT